MPGAAFNLLTEPWLPLKRRSGRVEWVSPADVTGDLSGDPFVVPAWGRADFDAATYEFLIGLLATAFNPQDEEDWRDLWRHPPSSDDLAAAFKALEPAFNLTGDGPRFMQELGGVEGEVSSVAGLFIESPGANTEKNNADLFQKRGQFPRLGLGAAAMALFTLQAYAPSGGAGHRTSLRGGGPLTTLVRPAKNNSLWAHLWLNLPVGYPTLPQNGGGATVFPWMGLTLSSENDKLPADLEKLHPLVSFWWMPRRIWLNVSASADSSTCALTGKETLQYVSGYRTRPWGMNAKTAQHPLSPMYRNKANDLEWLFVHPQPGGLPYHLWIDLAFASTSGNATRKPAEIVSHVLEHRKSMAGKPAQLWAAGYDMDNMKARGFIEVSFPLFTLENASAQQSLASRSREFLQAATQVASALRSAVRDVIKAEKTDATRLSSLSLSFFDATQAAFFDGIAAMASAYSADWEDNFIKATEGRKFLEGSLRPVALRLFDEAAPLTVLGTRMKSVECLIDARRRLTFALSGYGKDGRVIFDALGLPLPESKAAKSKAGSKAEARVTA